MWRRFDIVSLTTTKNIEFVSGPKGYPAAPGGYWSVIGNIPGKFKLMIAKEETVAVVPATDVRKIASYDIKEAMKILKNVKSLADLEKFVKENGGKNVKNGKVREGSKD